MDIGDGSRWSPAGPRGSDERPPSALGAVGAAVVVVDRDGRGAGSDRRRDRGRRWSGHGRRRGRRRRPYDVRRMFAEAERHFGGVDIVHNNAGLIGGEPLWPDVPLEKLMAVITVNLGGVAMGTQEGIHTLRRRGGGVIVNTASIAALGPMPADPVYSATKAGVVRITESCAGLAAEGIRVNAVLPGVVDTDMTNKHTGDGTRPAAWLQPLLARR